MAGTRLKSTKWRNTYFITRAQFNAFFYDWSSDVRKVLKNSCSLVKIYKRDFHIYGYAWMNCGIIVQFYVPDTRYFHNNWHDKIMLRTTETFGDSELALEPEKFEHTTTVRHMDDTLKELYEIKSA